MAPLMTKYENAPSKLESVEEGKETTQFWSDLYGGESASPRAPATAVTSSRLTPIAAAAVASKPSTAASIAVKMPLPRLALGGGGGGVGGGAANNSSSRVSPTAVSPSGAESVKSVEARRPASPVKLKLNLGTISVQRTTDLNLGSVPKKVVVPVMANLSTNSSSSSSSSSASEHSSSDSDEDSDSRSSSAELVESEPPSDVGNEPPLSARLNSSNTPRLRLGELQRGAGGPPSPGGALSPLSSPSLRQRLGLSSPKRQPPVTLTLEQARRALDSKVACFGFSLSVFQCVGGAGFYVERSAVKSEQAHFS